MKLKSTTTKSGAVTKSALLVASLLGAATATSSPQLMAGETTLPKVSPAQTAEQCASQCAGTCTCTCADACACSSPRADAHAPVGVMGDHVHAAGEWMLSARTMFMRMDGIRSGTNDLSSREVHALGFPVAPIEMDMWMHMFEVMYAPTDWVTLMLMTSYQEKKMEHLTAPGSMPRMMNGETFTRKESGWGDLSLSALVPVHQGKTSRAHLTLGLSAPTAESSPLPYPMQLGSDTWDLKLGATWSGRSASLSCGAQALGTIRLENEGDRGYAFPDQLETTGWLAYLLTDRVSASLRLSYLVQGDFEGRDPAIGAFMSPQMDATNLPSDRLDLAAGINLVAGKGHRFGLEVGVPVWEDSDGPRLATDWFLTAGWQWAF